MTCAKTLYPLLIQIAGLKVFILTLGSNIIDKSRKTRFFKQFLVTADRHPETKSESLLGTVTQKEMQIFHCSLPVVNKTLKTSGRRPVAANKNATSSEKNGAEAVDALFTLTA